MIAFTNPQPRIGDRSVDYAKDLLTSPKELGAGALGRKLLRGDHGRYWAAVPHAAAATTPAAACTARGWAVAEFRAHAPNEGTDLAASYAVTVPDVAGHYFVGILNSQSQRVALTLVAGVRVGDGAELALAERRVAKHTQRLAERLPELLADALEHVAAELPRFGRLARALRVVPLTPRLRDGLFVQAVHGGCLPAKYLGHLAREVAAERHPTAWDLLAAFARVARRTPPLTIWKRTRAFAATVAAACKVKFA